MRWVPSEKTYKQLLTRFSEEMIEAEISKLHIICVLFHLTLILTSDRNILKLISCLPIFLSQALRNDLLAGSSDFAE
jgi:hypothetical protein